MSEQKVVLVTGASSGIGQAIAGLLAQQDFAIFGTSRDPTGMEQISGVEVLPLDVCSDESVNVCMNAVLNRAGRLDVLVNNAGYVQSGAIEEVSVAEAMAQFETNFFGVLRMVRAALPYMRRQGGGQIINVSSLVALAPTPFQGIYSASKCALAGYTEALRHEVKPFNIKISLVEPGNIKSNLPRNRRTPAHHVSDYDPWRQRFADAMRSSRENAPEPIVVAECILSIIESPTPKLHYEVGEQVTRVSQARRSMPEEQFEQVVRKRFQLDA